MKERKKPLKGSVVLIGHPMESVEMKALSHTPHTRKDCPVMTFPFLGA